MKKLHLVCLSQDKREAENGGDVCRRDERQEGRGRQGEEAEEKGRLSEFYRQSDACFRSCVVIGLGSM